MSLDATYVKVCPTADVKPGQVIAAEVNDVPLAIVHCGDGEIRAVYDECSHAQIPLSEGEVDGCTLECWLHGSRFDLVTGRPTGLPATKPVPVYPVKIDGDDVLVDVEPVKES
jgi:3-phenylpropionate/trans-cinnamate dioxygenase ferredoxin component